MKGYIDSKNSIWIGQLSVKSSILVGCFFFQRPCIKRGSSVVRPLPLVLEVPGSIPTRGEKNFGVQTRFL